MADTPWGQGSKLYLQSGQFTSTIKTSQSGGSSVGGITYDNTNTPWVDSDNGFNKLHLQSGQFAKYQAC